MRDGSLVSYFVHHIEELSWFKISFLKVSPVGLRHMDISLIILGSGTGSARAIELPLICLDVNLFPIKSRVLQIASVCPRSGLL